jgi:hypothetical protein
LARAKSFWIPVFAGMTVTAPAGTIRSNLQSIDGPEQAISYLPLLKWIAGNQDIPHHNGIYLSQTSHWQ